MKNCASRWLLTHSNMVHGTHSIKIRCVFYIVYIFLYTVITVIQRTRRYLSCNQALTRTIRTEMKLSQSDLVLKSNTSFVKVRAPSQISHVDGLKNRQPRNPKIPPFNTVGANHAYKSSSCDADQTEIRNITVLLIAVI